MTVTSFEQWKASGSPWRDAPVISRFAGLLRNYGFTVYTLGDLSHLRAEVPEDHTPFSHTPWPGPQPYPLILALDVMPGGRIDWRDLGALIVDSRNAGLPGTDWIKYVNFTNQGGQCRHASWEPGYAVRPSADSGHIHISARTDRVDDQLHGWDPVAVMLGTPPVILTDPQGDPMFSNWPVLTEGNSGDLVRVAQGLLIANGLPVGSRDGLPDGAFGPTTAASTRSLQSHYGIAVDGQFGKHTLSVSIYRRDLA